MQIVQAEARKLEAVNNSASHMQRKGFPKQALEALSAVDDLLAGHKAIPLQGSAMGIEYEQANGAANVEYEQS